MCYASVCSFWRIQIVLSFCSCLRREAFVKIRIKHGVYSVGNLHFGCMFLTVCFSRVECSACLLLSLNRFPSPIKNLYVFTLYAKDSQLCKFIFKVVYFIIMKCVLFTSSHINNNIFVNLRFYIKNRRNIITCGSALPVPSVLHVVFHNTVLLSVTQQYLRRLLFCSTVTALTFFFITYREK